VLLRFQRDLSRVWVTAVRFHDPRHTFGTRMAAAGVPLCTLAEWMGHRDFKTMIYADYQPSDQEAELVERAFGGQREPDPEEQANKQPEEPHAAEAMRRGRRRAQSLRLAVLRDVRLRRERWRTRSPVQKRKRPVCAIPEELGTTVESASAEIAPGTTGGRFT
jgi:hypothetical protein